MYVKDYFVKDNLYVCKRILHRRPFMNKAYKISLKAYTISTINTHIIIIIIQCYAVRWL